MSRVGKNPVVLPASVSATLSGSILTVKGPKGELKTAIHKDMNVAIEDGQVTVTRPSDLKQHRALHGTTRANIQNMVLGVTEGYKKTLELVGVGYKVELLGSTLIMNIGFSHQMAFIPPKGITFEVATPTQLHISGIDKQLVGQMTAKIRAVRPPEPYKGKGIKYAGELIRRKAGKTAKS
ncbi:MAG: 50S ribosomal protein L6 [Bacteroidetes bacterium]|nr:50S ribosomal protein L6 [Bacteroidota bacterium]